MNCRWVAEYFPSDIECSELLERLLYHVIVGQLLFAKFSLRILHMRRWCPTLKRHPQRYLQQLLLGISRDRLLKRCDCRQSGHDTLLYRGAFANLQPLRDLFVSVTSSWEADPYFPVQSTPQFISRRQSKVNGANTHANWGFPILEFFELGLASISG